jgi:hypothetical protein
MRFQIISGTSIQELVEHYDSAVEALFAIVLLCHATAP